MHSDFIKRGGRPLHRCGTPATCCVLLTLESVLPNEVELPLAGIKAWLAKSDLPAVHTLKACRWVQVIQLAGVSQPGWRGQGPRQAQVLSDLAKSMKAMRDAFAAEMNQRG